ncbi:MAG: hypothetical protein H7338_19625 [Candidatus Sericytochromatia bacterium]|nr:hypothetical protein [Candidatus Sericytochromatia bacterium]
MTTRRRNQILLAGFILALLALLSFQMPALTPWFVVWLLAGFAISAAYKRREARLIGFAVVALVILAGIGLYPIWQGAMRQVTVTSSFGIARSLTDRLIKLAHGRGGRLPDGQDPAWQSLTAGLKNPYRQTPITGHVAVVSLPHRAALPTAVETLRPDPAKAGDLTVFLAESKFFIIVPRDEHGVPLPFSDEFSNLKTSKQGTGEARAVDQGIPGNQRDSTLP